MPYALAAGKKSKWIPNPKMTLVYSLYKQDDLSQLQSYQRQHIQYL